MHLIVISISCFGSFGGEAQSFFSELGRRVGGGVPHLLLDEASWAAPRFAPFVRMALGCAARRGMAESIYQLWRRVSPAPAPHPHIMSIPIPLRPAPPPSDSVPQHGADPGSQGSPGEGSVLPPLADQVPGPIPGSA